MSKPIPIGIWYENGRTPMKVGYPIIGATSFAKGNVVAIDNAIMMVDVTEGEFVDRERLIGVGGSQIISRPLTTLERLAAEA
jgi:hypothetical protein